MTWIHPIAVCNLILRLSKHALKDPNACRRRALNSNNQAINVMLHMSQNRRSCLFLSMENISPSHSLAKGWNSQPIQQYHLTLTWLWARDCQPQGLSRSLNLMWIVLSYKTVTNRLGSLHSGSIMFVSVRALVCTILSLLLLNVAGAPSTTSEATVDLEGLVISDLVKNFSASIDVRSFQSGSFSGCSQVFKFVAWIFPR